ncbi:unnamed protein product [Closterium sp. Naga37s-1]|nr:unnamed protein product [Closterium sp. Naga37s-1]
MSSAGFGNHGFFTPDRFSTQGCAKHGSLQRTAAVTREATAVRGRSERWDDARPAATRLPPTRPADHPLCSRRALQARRRTGERGGMTHGRQPLACGCLLLALLTTRSRQGGHLEQGGKHATLGARGKEETWGKEEEATRRHFSTALHAPPLPTSDAQPDLHSVLNPFPPSTLKEGGAAAWRVFNTVTDM